MLKGKGTITFKFYEDPMGMQKYVMRPREEEEAEEPVEDDSQETLDLEAEKEEEEQGETPEETPERPANTGEPLVLTPHRGGLCTGSSMTISFECSKDVMRSLLEAEARGLAPFFSFSIQ